MRLLLDTNIVIALTPHPFRPLSASVNAAIRANDNVLFVSVASIWEVAIKYRLGKLDLGMPPTNFAAYLEAIGVTMFPIARDHVLVELDPQPETRDPFDRLLLAQCQVEDLRLITRDRVLAAHPLAWR
jgi:PIN domain nuclease of toxin-antitoxin system